MKLTNISSIKMSFTLLLLLGLEIIAQPPAIGPGPNRTQAGELSVFTLTVGVKAKALDIVNQTNADLQAAGESARVSLKEVKAFKPSRVPTRFDDRPNSTIVRAPFFVNIEVKIPVFGNRFIHIPIDVEVACDGWQNTTGNIGVRAVPGPAAITGGSIFEDIIQVRGMIDAKVRNNFTQPLPSIVPSMLADPRCKTIGVTDFGTAIVTDDAINFDRPPSRPIISTIGGRFSPTVEVTFNRLKRLNARDFRNGVVYRDVEQIFLNAFANYEQRQKSLSMREGDDVALNLPPVTLSAGLFDKLVVIGNIEQPPNNPKDTGFRTSLKTQNFEPGTFTVIIPKFYTRPPDQFNPHPTIVRVDAYELSYTVKFNQAVIVQ